MRCQGPRKILIELIWRRIVLRPQGLFFGFFDVVTDIFGDEFPELFPSIFIMPGGEFRSADPARFEKKALVRWTKLGNVSGDTGHLDCHIAIVEDRLDFSADLDGFR